MSDYRRLAVWQRAFSLAAKTYRYSRAFPASEQFGLTDQMRRAATSIAANIAEGAGRASDTEFARFLRIGRGSLHELTCEIMLATELDYLSTNARDELLADADAVGSALVGLLRAITTKGRIRK